MNLATWLVRAGKGFGEYPAVAHGDKPKWNYGLLAERVARLAGALRATFGLNPGDRVAVIAKNCPEYVEVMYAIWHAGLVSVPVNAKLHGAEYGFILENTGAAACFVTTDTATAVSEHAPESLKHIIEIGAKEYHGLFKAEPVAMENVGPDDVAWLFYTSGTTGRPKGAMLTHRNLMAMSLSYLTDVDVVGPGDSIVHAAPMSHGSGLYMPAHLCRLGVQVIPESGGFDASECFRLFDAWPGASMFAAPTIINRMTACPDEVNPDNIRTLVYGGAPMYVEDAIRGLDRFGPHLAQIYGQGESPMTITYMDAQQVADRNHPGWMERLASVGVPHSVVEVRVVDEDDRPLPAGETGEVIVRGDTVMKGYWQNEEATAAGLKNGWLHTGDVGAFNEDGFLFLKDRSKDVIISGGTNIYPREVEEVLLKHDKVEEVSVIGRPDKDWGEIVVAYVVGDVSTDELDKLCLDNIARFKRPKDYVFVDALPKNNYGKVLKTQLREQDSKKANL